MRWMLVTLIVAAWVTSAWGQFDGGLGTPEYPYLISTPSQLNTIGQSWEYMSKHFRLTDDIDMSIYTGTQYNVIGNYNDPFSGSFDGDGHFISNLIYSTTAKTSCVGMFGYADGATIINVTLLDVTVETKGVSLGGLAGNFRNGIIDNCHVTGSITGDKYIGGLIGYLHISTISNSHTACIVHGTSNTGGLVGYKNYGTISDCYATGDVSGGACLGGLVGKQQGGDVVNCFATGSISGTSQIIGGLVGENQYCTINNCYATGSVSGTSSIGGLVGMGGDICCCYASGSVSGNSYVGGLVGHAYKVVNSYSTGMVTGSNDVGGLAGSSAYGFVINSFWDTDTSGLAESAIGDGRTTTQLMQASNYVAWNTPTVTNWIIDDEVDYPRLFWEGTFGMPLSSEVFDDFIPGGGTESDPYRISTPFQLNTIGLFPDVWDKYFILENNIDMAANSGMEYHRIGFESDPFSGTFDGNGHVIVNFSYSTTYRFYDIGLFGYADGALIRNVGLENVTIEAEGSYIGSLVGHLKNSTISNCYATGNVTSVMMTGRYMGGLVGYQDLCMMTDCYFSGNISGDGYIGGLVGANYNTTITSCYANAVVSGDEYLGGLVGASSGDCISSFARGTVSGSERIGGLAGFQDRRVIRDCYCTTTLTGQNSVGGLVGSQGNSSLVYRCYSAGAITANTSSENVGGLVGAGGHVSNSFWDMQISGLNDSAGGNGRTTDELMQADNYIVWNTPTETNWVLDEGADYPRLVWEGTPGAPLSSQVFSDYIPGAGTELQPYRISTAQQLNTIGLFPDEWDKYFIQENEIDMSAFVGGAYNRIGVSNNHSFTGVFDGQNYTISNLTYSTTKWTGYIGLFGYGEWSTIKNVNLENIFIASKGSYMGGILGYHWFGTINDCSVSGEIAGGSVLGGLIGYHAGGDAEINYSYADVNITGESSIGGLAGWVESANVNNCYATGDVTGIAPDSNTLGGLLGYAMANPEIKNCYAAGNVSGGGYMADFVGGLVGHFAFRDYVYDCFWDVQTSGQSTAGYNVVSGATGLTTAEMQTLAPFESAGWDFDRTWLLFEGYGRYPELVWQHPGEMVGPYGVDVLDLAAFSEMWLSTTTGAGDWAPEGGDGFVDLLDLAMLAEHWLEGI